MAKLWNGYLHLLKTRTLPTQMVTGGFTSGLGDILYQQAFERRGWAGHEVRSTRELLVERRARLALANNLISGAHLLQMYRTRRLMFFGCFCFTPVANRWHLLLSKIELSSLWKSESRQFRRTSADSVSRGCTRPDRPVGLCPVSDDTLLLVLWPDGVATLANGRGRQPTGRGRDGGPGIPAGYSREAGRTSVAYGPEAVGRLWPGPDYQLFVSPQYLPLDPRPHVHSFWDVC